MVASTRGSDKEQTGGTYWKRWEIYHISYMIYDNSHLYESPSSEKIINKTVRYFKSIDITDS